MLEIVRHATARAVTVVPEVPTTLGVRSWSQHPKFRNLTIKCESYFEQLDVSNPLAREVARAVIQELQSLFGQEFLHLSGFQASAACYEKGRGLATFMKLHNIRDYQQLQEYWRGQLREMVVPGTRLIFWDSGLAASPQDLLQVTASYSAIGARAKLSGNQLILSPKNLLDLSVGLGDSQGLPESATYVPWEWVQWYFKLEIKGLEPARLLGLEGLLWGQGTNEPLLDNNLWMRGAALALKGWYGDALDYPAAFNALTDLAELYTQLGVQASPLNRQYNEQQAAPRRRHYSLNARYR